MDPSGAFSRLDLTTGATPGGRPGDRPVPSGRELPMLPDPLPVGAPPAFHVLVKPRGAICNLDCTYCFFLSKEALYPGSAFRMDEGVLDQYVRQLLESHRTEHVAIAWQGGEPTLMGLDFFRGLLELVERYRRPGQVIEHSIQTNGTLLDDEWAAFFAEHGFLVGLSMDGPPDIHDAQRVDKGGAPTHARVLRAARLLAAAGAESNILCTVHAVNGDRGREVYRYFRDEVGARFVQFIPIIERTTPELIQIAEAGWGSGVKGRPLYTQSGSLVTSRSVGSEQWGRFLIDVFEEWVRRDVGRVFVQMFDVTLGNFVGAPPSLCIHSETCGGRPGHGAQRRPVQLRPLRGARLPPRQHHGDAPPGAGGVTPAAPLRPGQARQAAALLPGVRRALRLPRRLPQGPLPRRPLRRARRSTTCAPATRPSSGT